MPRRGFTLIELLVVISIISLLASITLTSVNEARVKARDSIRLQNLIQVRNAIEQYYSDKGHYPSLNSAPTYPYLDCVQCRVVGFSPQSVIKTALSNYINIPKDPTPDKVSATPNYLNGLWYKTDPASKNYKLAWVGIENINNVPTNFRDDEFSPMNKPPHVISVYSSPVSQAWKMSPGNP